MRFELRQAGDLKAVNRALRQAASGRDLLRKLPAQPSRSRRQPGIPGPVLSGLLKRRMRLEPEQL
jgi:hypothetical protein